MKKEPKNVLLGIGNILRCDDGAGSFIAQHFHHHYWITLDGKSAPENVTSVIKKIQPQLLVIIDAAQMNLHPGDFRIIASEKIVSLQLSTHSMPLYYLIEYLSPYCQKIVFIGIQPLSTQIGEKLNEPVLKGCYQLMELLQKNETEKIIRL